MRNASTQPISRRLSVRRSLGDYRSMLPYDMQNSESTFYVPSPPPELEGGGDTRTMQQVLAPKLAFSRPPQIPRKDWKHVDVKVMAKVRMPSRPDPQLYMKLLRNPRHSHFS